MDSSPKDINNHKSKSTASAVKVDIAAATTSTSTSLTGLAFSSIAALVTRCLTHPIDTIKVIIQADTTFSSSPSSQSKCNNNIASVLKTHSIKSLYQGLGIAAIFSVPALSLYLHTYDQCKERIALLITTPPTPNNTHHHDNLNKNNKNYGRDLLMVHAISAAAAETISGIFWTPMEVVKNKLQVSTATQGLNHSKTIPLMKQIFKSEGIQGFFKGYFLNLAVFVPYTVIYFITYERLKLLVSSNTISIPLITRSPSSVEENTSPVQVELTFTSYATCSAISGAMAGAISNALDVVKTRVQISGLESKINAWNVIKDIHQNEGFIGFTRGLLPRVAWITPSVVLSMSIYEVLKDWHKKRRNWST